jgi:hypothetical protein
MMELLCKLPQKLTILCSNNAVSISSDIMAQCTVLMIIHDQLWYSTDIMVQCTVLL